MKKGLASQNNRWTRHTSGFVAVLTALFLVACESGPEPPEEEFPVDPDLPEAVVDLPDPPPASAFEINEHNDDGTLRVEGLIGNRDQYLEEEVEVRAMVSEIKGTDCDPSVEACTRTHLIIRDDADDDLSMMAVGYHEDFLQTAGIREGEEYLFIGNYDQMAHGFVSSEDGLIDLMSVDDHEVPE